MSVTEDEAGIEMELQLTLTKGHNCPAWESCSNRDIPSFDACTASSPSGNGNLAFARRLTAMSSVASRLRVWAEFHFGRSSNGGFWSGKVENALSFSGD
jgi:hypothetical protein